MLFEDAEFHFQRSGNGVAPEVKAGQIVRVAEGGNCQAAGRTVAGEDAEAVGTDRTRWCGRTSLKIGKPLVAKARKRKWMTPSQIRLEMSIDAAVPGTQALVKAT